jgi:hypothetical protein
MNNFHFYVYVAVVTKANFEQYGAKFGHGHNSKLERDFFRGLSQTLTAVFINVVPDSYTKLALSGITL